jgi:hypothetical protein
MPEGRPRGGMTIELLFELAVAWGGENPRSRRRHQKQAPGAQGAVDFGVGVGDRLPDGLIAVPLLDMPPSRLVVAWNTATSNPLIRSFTEIAAGIYLRISTSRMQA